MSFLRNVSPSIRGISISSVITSGTSLAIFLAAKKGSDAVPITLMLGSLSNIEVSACLTTAESSTISVFILLALSLMDDSDFYFIMKRCITSPDWVLKTIFRPSFPPVLCASTGILYSLSICLAISIFRGPILKPLKSVSRTSPPPNIFATRCSFLDPLASILSISLSIATFPYLGVDKPSPFHSGSI